LPIRPSLEGKGAGKLAAELAMSWQEAYSLRFSGFTPGQRMYLQGGHSLDRVCYWRSPDDIGPAPEGRTGLHQLQAIDFANYLPEYILQKSDLCTMAHGLEGRAPLLDHRLFHTLLSVAPAERFTHPAKLIFRRAMSPALPADFFLRKKRGFNPPLARWLKISLAERFQGLGARLSRLSDGRLDAAAIDKFVAAYLNGVEHLAEQMLQLLILDESLEQLTGLRAALPDVSAFGTRNTG
jgi:asparagine synthase (glutamine-hydrolysing)